MFRRSAAAAVLLCLASAFAAAQASTFCPLADRLDSIAATGIARRDGVILAPERLSQGDPLIAYVAFAGMPSSVEASLKSEAGKPVQAATPFALESPHAFGLVMAIPMNQKPGDYLLTVRGSLGPGDPAGATGVAGATGSAESSSSAGVIIEVARRLVVEARPFPSEDIALDEANSRLMKVSDPKKEAEARRLSELLGRVDVGSVYYDGAAFPLPVDSTRTTAGFGDRRRYLYATGGSDSSVHGGIDFGVPKGTAVIAPARGKVVFAEERIVTGLTVVIEHLPGLFSLYMHLSRIDASAGTLVEKGARIGLSGSTGLSTGPHLHWELRARGFAVDPAFLVRSPPLDKDTLIATISALIEGR